jgi:hypothetical protein
MATILSLKSPKMEVIFVLNKQTFFPLPGSLLSYAAVLGIQGYGYQ